MTVVDSNTKPSEISFVDGKVKNGVTMLRVCWNIQQVQKTDPMTSETRTAWQYSERVIPWQINIDDVGTGTLEEITAYLALDATKASILSWAKGSGINL